MKKKLFLNGQEEWPETIEMVTDIVERRNPKRTTEGGKAVFAPEDLAEQAHEYVLAQSIGDTDLNDLYEEAERFSLRVVYVKETRAKGKVNVEEYKEYVLEDLLPVQLITSTGDNKVYLTLTTMTPPERNPDVKPEVEAAGA